MKASTIAYPIQGLIKYHGMKDEKLRLPYHNSISVCTSPTYTHTTIEFTQDSREEKVEIDGKETVGRELERVMDVINRVREIAEVDYGFILKSKNNFPSNIGLGASSSGFAAIAVAACGALNLDLDKNVISAIARRGAGSVSRSVAGGFAEWKVSDKDEECYAIQLAGPEDLQMGIVAGVVRAFKNTEDAHKEAVSSPLFNSRLAYIESAIREMKDAIKNKDLERIMWLAERDTLNLHAVTMTGKNLAIAWRPDTLKIVFKVRELRQSGIPAYFSIDTGATVYVNTYPNKVKEVEKALKELEIETMICEVGPEAKDRKRHV